MDGLYRDINGNCDYTYKEYEDLKEMTKLSDGIFHDFKNILSNISGLTQLSMLVAESQDLQNNLKSIYEATSEFKFALNRYEELMHGVNRFSKSPCQLHEIIDKAISTVNYRFIDKNSRSNIKLITNINTDIEILCNPYEVNQAFLNLIMNSIEAMEESGGTLSINVYGIDDLVCISIKDNGPGISEGEINSIFNYRFTTKEKGSGLGLNIAKATIEDNGGKIDLTSLKGKGTEVRVYLPIYKKHRD